MAKRGQKCTYTQAVADEICRRLSDGESLRAICRDPGMPPDSTVRNWVLDDVNGFATQYARAKDFGIDRLAEEILEIADTPEPGEVEVSKPNGVEVKRGDMIEHRRLKVDSRKWYVAKLAPKRYGDRTAIDLAGSLDIGKLSTDELKAELAALIGAQQVVKPQGNDDGDDGSDLV